MKGGREVEASTRCNNESRCFTCICDTLMQADALKVTCRFESAMMVALRLLPTFPTARHPSPPHPHRATAAADRRDLFGTSSLAILMRNISTA